MTGRTHVWLLTLGAPPDQDGARGWLEALLADPDAVQPGIPAFLRRLWAWFTCWRRAPALVDHCARAAPGTQELELHARDLGRILGPHYAVRLVHRYAEHAADQAARDLGRHDRVVLLPLDAHVGGATTISPLLDARRALAASNAPRAEVRGYPDHPAYVDAVAQTLREALLALPDDAVEYEVVFCARGLLGRPGPYPDQVAASVAAVVDRCRLTRPHHLAYTRSPGGSGGPTPQVLDLVAERGRAGVTSLVLVPLGFTTECRETRIELDEDAATAAREAGVRHVQRAATVATRPGFLRALADLVHEAEDEAAWELPWRQLPEPRGDRAARGRPAGER